MRPPTETHQSVTCETCRHFRRDTSGANRNSNGVYFMGICALGRDPDKTFNKRRGTAKIFADNKRECNKYEAK